MERWTFYTAAGTCALATHIALHEAGATFELVKLDLGAQQQQSADYLAINPKGRVPALRTPQGVLTETPALLAFIAQRFPEAGLAPLDNAFAFARLQEFTSYLASTVHVAHAHKRRGARWADDAAAIEAMRLKVPQTMTACASLLEIQLGAGPWVLGERYSVADAYLFTLTGWMDGDGVDMARFPSLQAHHERMARRPAVQRALAEAES
ncbi:glutathione S-transferase family protein [Azohydromonas lata]|uniref:Glutathione S-transferase N-terminal domain-containing protein n=1 Tax=Azohydromonas lata TaxID=45677 RepID=A0ABU5IHM5_9BURK|nr:glutathione S-transferase N-terminal domain-containing protein [Azohydromonas lata]MDZ5458000.1 glutathione S-transferase N-terminal domain-containing protein [Azohydromonas lata]